MLYKIIIMIMLYPCTIFAQPGCSVFDISKCKISLYVDGWSVHHVNYENKYNESQQTKGIAIDHFSYIEFINSFGKPGRAVYVSAPLYNAKHFRAGLLFTMMYGYTPDPQPMLLPFAKIGYDPIWINASCLPAVSTGEYICAFILEIRIQ